MRILMLGWEFPPHISGGLGTACEGLATALAAHGHELTFIVPQLTGDEQADYMQLIASRQGPPAALDAAALPATPEPEDELVATPGEPERTATPPAEDSPRGPLRRSQPLFDWVGVPSPLQPYLTPEAYLRRVQGELPLDLPLSDDVVGDPYAARLTGELYTAWRAAAALAAADPALLEGGQPAAVAGERAGGSHYGRDLFAEVARFASEAAERASELDFDCIHCHDWMTYPAGLLIREQSGKPLICHVHSLEHDRSGPNPQPRIDQIERGGTATADRVIAVSHYTADVIAREHGVPRERIDVVHNGITRADDLRARHEQRPKRADRTVLFLGRVTMQKGPEYFIEAAAKVIPRMPNVKFVMAGDGDMLEGLIERVAELGLSRYFHFTGFVKGKQLELMFAIADCYVMPSVSEPFGIAPLEALVRDTPVIISKQSGVAEVLKHALRVDFWDTDRLAALICATLEYPAIKETMTTLGSQELLALRWDAAAAKVSSIYQQLAPAAPSAPAEPPAASAEPPAEPPAADEAS